MVNMDLTLKDRLIISNQLKILEKLYPDEASYYSAQRKAIENGYKHHYDDLVTYFFDEMPEEDSKEVVDILDMYRALTFSYQNLGDKSGIGETSIRFRGFDGNNEASQLVYVGYFIVDLERFDELKYGQKSPDFNSHAPMLDKYRRMLTVWNGLENRFELSKEQIIAILQA
jgi:uncharacterized protein